MVKVAAVQHAVAEPLTDPINVQKRKTFEKVGRIIDAAAAEGVNILCLQELWCKASNEFLIKKFTQVLFRSSIFLLYKREAAMVRICRRC